MACTASLAATQQLLCSRACSHAYTSCRAALPPVPALRRRRAARASLRCAASLQEGVSAVSGTLVSADLSTTLFALGQQADALVNANLTEVTPVTYAVVLVRSLGRARAAAPQRATHARPRHLPLCSPHCRARPLRRARAY